MSALEENFLTLEDPARAPRSTWSAVRSALVADILRRSARLRQRVRLRVLGESMLPTLWPGDVVEIESCSLEDARSGEVVLALRDGRLFLHRLVGHCNTSCTPDGFLLRGDSVACPDPPLPSEALLGRLVRRADGRVNEGRGLTASALRLGFAAKWSRAVGMLFCHWGLARRVALKVHSRRKASARRFRTAENTEVPVSAVIAEPGAV